MKKGRLLVENKTEASDMVTSEKTILYIIDGLEFGGGERVFLQLIVGLKERFRVIIGANPGSEFQRKVKELGCEFYPVPMKNRFNLKAILEIRNIILSKQVDIIHSQGARADFFSRAGSRLAGKAANVCTIAMPVEGFDTPFPLKKLYRIFDFLTEKWVSKFLVVSEELKHLLVNKRNIPQHKVITVYNGIELEAYKSGDGQRDFPNELKVSSGYPVICAVGRMVWQKGFDFFLESIPLILNKIPEAYFVLIGDGPLLDKLKRRSVKMGISDRILFAGFRDDILEILTKMDILVVPSLLEGFPMIVLEGMALGKLIVATQIPGIKEQIENGKEGVLVTARDPVSISNAVINVMSRPDSWRKQIGNAARRKVEKQFSVEKMIEKTAAVYQEIIGIGNLCPYCSQRGKKYFKHYGRVYWKCASCRLIYKSISENKDAVAGHYRVSEYDRYSTEAYEKSREPLFRHILEIFKNRGSKGRLLDVGTGTGTMLVMAKERGWQVEGVEVSPAAKIAMARGLSVFSGPLQAFSATEFFDAVTFINVLEHIVAPWEELQKAKLLLKRGGLLYVRFPNGELHSKLARLTNRCHSLEKYRNFFVFHEYSFTDRFIERLLQDLGFVDIRIKNSPSSGGNPYRQTMGSISGQKIKNIVDLTAETLSTVTGGKSFFSPSIEVTAIRP